MTTPSSKRLILYGLLFLAAIVGLLVDRLHFSPSPAKGDDATQAVQPTAPASASPDIGDSIGPEIAAIFEPKSTAATAPAAEPIRDAFTTTPKMDEHFGRRTTRRSGQRPAGGEDEPDPIDTEAFLAKHKLQATSIQKKGSWALIDDRVLRVGDNLDGFLVRQIDHYRVTFEGQSGEFDLTLPVGLSAKVTTSAPR